MMMSEIRLLLKMARVVQTPRDALILLAAAATLISIAYVLPDDFAQ